MSVQIAYADVKQWYLMKQSKNLVNVNWSNSVKSSCMVYNAVFKAEMQQFINYKDINSMQMKLYWY